MVNISAFFSSVLLLSTITLNLKKPPCLSPDQRNKVWIEFVPVFACVGEWVGPRMLNAPIHKPHRQKNYCSSTGKSTGGETLKLDVLRAVQTHTHTHTHTHTQTHTAGRQRCQYWILAKETSDSVASGWQSKRTSLEKDLQRTLFSWFFFVIVEHNDAYLILKGFVKQLPGCYLLLLLHYNLGF